MERNYREDQHNEIEALDAIYPELEILEIEPFHKFALLIKTEDFKQDTEEKESGLFCKTVFSFNEKYPDVAPCVEIEENNFDDRELLTQLLQDIKKCIEENLGMEMIFTLVCSIQEFLNQQFDNIKKRREEEIDNLKLQQEEAERKKFEGTRVNVETFLAWRTQFEIETGIAAKKEKASVAAKKLTGKELFLRDNTLNDSDIKFLLEAGDSIESVKIDESLFQNIEDLELGSDDDDDEDYNPDNDN